MCDKKESWLDILRRNEEESKARIRKSQVEDMTDYVIMCSEDCV